LLTHLAQLAIQVQCPAGKFALAVPGFQFFDVVMKAIQIEVHQLGYLVQVDVEKGTWRIFNLEDEKEYSGEASRQILQGVTVETVNYKLTCLEIIEEPKVSEKEKTKYILQVIEKVE